MTRITIPPLSSIEDESVVLPWEHALDNAVYAAIKGQGSASCVHAGSQMPVLDIVVDHPSHSLSFTTPQTGAVYTWSAHAQSTNKANSLSDALRCAAIVPALILILPQIMPDYTAAITEEGLVVHRKGLPYATLTIQPYSSWYTDGNTAVAWRGPIHGKPWNAPMSCTSDIVRALLKRETIHAPIFAFRDSQTGLYYGGHEWPANILTYVPQRSKARTFKRLSDASGHASMLAGVGAQMTPTEPGWKDAIKWGDGAYDVSGAMRCPVPMPPTLDLISIDKATKVETVIDTGPAIQARVQRRLALQRNVVSRFGQGSTAAIDEAQKAERTDLDTLVLLLDAQGRADVRGALKTAGVAGKKSIARKTTYPRKTLLTWSVALPQAAVAAFLAALPADVLVGQISFAQATA